MGCRSCGLRRSGPAVTDVLPSAAISTPDRGAYRRNAWRETLATECGGFPAWPLERLEVVDIEDVRLAGERDARVLQPRPHARRPRELARTYPDYAPEQALSDS